MDGWMMAGWMDGRVGGRVEWVDGWGAVLFNPYRNRRGFEKAYGSRMTARKFTG